MRLRRVLRHCPFCLLRSRKRERFGAGCVTGWTCSGRASQLRSRFWIWHHRAQLLISYLMLPCASSANDLVPHATPGSIETVPPLQILAFAIGDVSGAHINPAVTASLAVTGNLAAPTALIYVIAQILGGERPLCHPALSTPADLHPSALYVPAGLAGGGLLYAALGPDLYKSGIGLSVGAGGGLLFEFMGTLLLIFVVFNVAVRYPCLSPTLLH